MGVGVLVMAGDEGKILMLIVAALVAVFIFIGIFSWVRDMTYEDLGAGADIVALFAALGVDAAIFGSLSVALHWNQ